jgi:hypothetical protein
MSKPVAIFLLELQRSDWSVNSPINVVSPYGDKAAACIGMDRSGARIVDLRHDKPVAVPADIAGTSTLCSHRRKAPQIIG